MAWSQALAVEGRQSPDDALQAIQKASVADVNRVAVKYLQPHQSIEAILVPEAAGRPVSARPRAERDKER
jgi:zinc protease